MSYKVSVVIERDEDGYFAYCPELQGCHTQGASLDEVLENIREAAALYLETLAEAEIRERLSRSILTTSVDVSVA